MVQHISIVRLPSLSSDITAVLRIVIGASVLLASCTLRVLFARSSAQLVSTPLVDVFSPVSETRIEDVFRSVGRLQFLCGLVVVWWRTGGGTFWGHLR